MIIWKYGFISCIVKQQCFIFDKNTVMEVVTEIENLKFKLKERMYMHYLRQTVRNQLRNLEENSWFKIKTDSFKSNILKTFYQKCIQYVDIRSSQFKHINCFKWIPFKNVVNWLNVQNSFQYISKFNDKMELFQDEKKKWNFLMR